MIAVLLEFLKPMKQTYITFLQVSTDRSASDSLRVTPFGIRKLLNWIKDSYGNWSIYITENGYAGNGDMEDTGRMKYYIGYINNVLKGRFNPFKSMKFPTVINWTVPFPFSGLLCGIIHFYSIDCSVSKRMYRKNDPRSIWVK